MCRSLIFSVLTLALLFTSVSCTKKVSPSNHKEAYYGQYSFFVNNNNVSKAIIYKRYIDNKKH